MFRFSQPILVSKIVFTHFRIIERLRLMLELVATLVTSFFIQQNIGKSREKFT